MNDIVDKMGKFIGDNTMSNENIFIIDFYLGEESGVYRDFCNKLKKYGSTHETEITSNRILKSDLNIYQLKEALIKFLQPYEGTKCIIIDFTNKRIEFINIDNNIIKLFRYFRF